MKFSILIVFVFSSFLLFSQEDSLLKEHIQNQEFELQDDDPVLVMIDSITVSGYFEALGLHDHFEKSTKYDYAIDSVPEFDSLTYATRFAKLNANSPFSLVYNSYTKGYVNLYAKRRKKTTAKMLGLAPVYFPIFEENLDKYNLPLELKYLAIVESALNPKAKSRVGATGLWQFMYQTGKMYDLKVTSYYDERSDVYKSTDAACRYLKKLHSMYDDWDLALAAYNCGPGNVNKAIRRSGGKNILLGNKKFFTSRNERLCSAFIAVNYVMNYAEEHNISPVKPDISCFKVDTVGVKEHLSFAQLSETLEIPMEYLEYLNPAYKNKFIPATEGAMTLCLPYEKMGEFLTNEQEIYAHKTLQDIKDSIAVAQNKMVEPTRGDAIVYRVKSGDVLGKIAAKYHCRVSQIKDWNNLHSDRLNIGQKLYIYAKPSYAAQNKKKAEVDAEKRASKTISDGKYVYYTIKEGDNLWDIANKYDDVTIDQIMELNQNVDTKNLKLGTKIKIKPVG